MKNVSIGIVTYNNQNEIGGLLDCLSSNCEVYVADNNSTDSTLEVVRKYSFVHVLANKKNLGFGKAHNEILKLLGSKYHLVVNPDIRIQPSVIDEIVKFMDLNPDVVVMCPKVLNADGTEQYLPKRNPRLKYMLSSKLENKSEKYQHIRDEYTLKNENVTGIRDVEFCTGCFMVCRTDALKQIGGFDTRYFLYMEDADLTRMLRKIGRTVYNPSITVTHLWKRDSAKKLSALVKHLTSFAKYLIKWSGDKA